MCSDEGSIYKIIVVGIITIHRRKRNCASRYLLEQDLNKNVTLVRQLNNMINYKFTPLVALIIVTVFCIGTTFFYIAYQAARGIVEESKQAEMADHMRYNMYGQIDDRTYVQWERMCDTGEYSRYYYIKGTLRLQLGQLPNKYFRIVELPGTNWKHKISATDPAETKVK